MSERPYIGGQAVLEGVMMRSPRSLVVAVRRPDGRIAVRDILASISASHHMLSAPQAPAPPAIAESVAMSFIQSIGAGARAKPTAPVKTTSDMTRGLSRTR